MDLSNFGLKNTKARECLINLLKESKDPKTAEELYLNLPQGLTNLSTVYRTLHTFCEAGIISKEIRPDGKALYSYSSFEHHHVLICIKCNKKIYCVLILPDKFIKRILSLSVVCHCLFVG